MSQHLKFKNDQPNTRIHDLTFALCVVGLLFVAACASLTPAQKTAISQTDTALKAQLPPNAQPYLYAAEAIYAAYEGLTIPPSSIDTGNAKVDAVLQTATTAAPVVKQDLTTLQNLVDSFKPAAK